MPDIKDYITEKLQMIFSRVKISEPEKCSELVWININNLPEDMIDFEIEAIKNNQLGIKFSVNDTDDEKKLVLKKVGDKNE